MTNIILPVVGGAAGFMLGGPTGAMIGANLGSMASGLFAKSQRVQLPSQEGPRLSDLRAQTSTYGNIIPRVYGTMRLAGNIIWSTNIKEVRNDHTVRHRSGGGKGRSVTTSQTTTTYSYFVTLAIAICEGPIDEVIRVWADSKILTSDILAANRGSYNVHLGDEEQQTDDIIAKYKPAGSFSSYRGIAYVVIEDFPLADFGNRIPNFSFEVRRQLRFKPSVEDKIKEIVMIPGSGEFVYSTNVCTKQDFIITQRGDIPYKGKKLLNMHNYEGKADVVLAIDQMLKVLPNLKWVSIVVTWFANNSDASKCEIIPKVEFHGNTNIYPQEWSVAGYTRVTAEEVLRFDANTPTYGGTPSDNTILELIKELKSRGLKIMLYPMIFVDEIKPEAKPWRGKIKPDSADTVNNWFTKANGYNRFITHYAHLTKGEVDAFIIGSELVGMTSFTDSMGNYPAVNQLINLASTIKSIVGITTQITYAADWSEYHSINGWYNLDPLWSSPNIDFIGIDAYFPLTEDLPQAQITEEHITNAWESGEGWDYYCNNDRTQKLNYPNAKYAWKNLEYWWNNTHINPDGNATKWQAKMKPVWFTEIGFPSIDACANQPNVFYDPSSCESVFPRNSRGRINFQAQREALNASLRYLQARNAKEGNSDLIPKSFIWCWDARPFSFWPDLENIWKDNMLWAIGHWVNGKLGNSTLGAIVGELFQLTGLNKSDFDVTRLTETVEGYIILQPITVRAALEQLAAAYFFDVVESDGILKCIPRGGSSSLSISQDELIPTDKNGVQDTLEIVRAQELELPQRVNVTYIDRPFNYDPMTQSSQRQTVKAVEQVMLNLPLVMNATLAKKIADVTLYGAWKERVSFALTLPPKYVRIEPTDIVTVNIADATYQMRVVKTDMERNGLMKVLAVAEDINSYDFHSNTSGSRSNIKLPELIPDTILELLDLPPLPGSSEAQGLLGIAVAGNGDDWNGAAIYSSNEGDNNYTLMTGISASATMGVITTNLSPSFYATWDETSIIEVILFSGCLFSVSELILLNGANAAMIGDELIQFQNAELIGDSTYRLSRLLRGRQGTEHNIKNQESGTRFVLIDSSLYTAAIPTNLIGRTLHYKAVTVGNSLENADERAITYQANGLKSFAPVHIIGNRDEQNNLTISWIRRSRLNADWRDFVDVALTEESEQYQIEIMDKDTVVRTLETSTPNITYTTAEQITDFKVIPHNITIKIYQMSAVIGRGHAAVAII